MKNQKEKSLFANYIAANRFKSTKQRNTILQIFLETEQHLSAEELYRLVQKKHHSIGYATVYRTLKLLSECGLCRELKPEDGITRYEHLYEHQHHDHFICTKCGKIIEVLDDKIEFLQEKLAKKYSFIIERHHTELYGICKQCKSKHTKALKTGERTNSQ
jgi:Fur family ferric uptake transcriptional regulator